MSIGTIIKKLRRERDMTQEELAGLLNLTPAAVSGWECDRNAPDISQLPMLSHIFGVSADVLLGIDVTAQEEKIEAVIARAESLPSKEAAALYRDALREFPASYRLMLRLADNLDYRNEPETWDARVAEQIALYEKIRETCREPYYKNVADGRLCGIYIRQGKRDEARKIADGVPHFLYPRTSLDRMLAEGMEKIHEMHHGIHGKFADLCDDMYFFSMLKVDGKPFFTHEQAITILEKIPKLHEIYYEDGDFRSTGQILAWSYTRMAEHYAELRDAENALRCIHSAAEHARAMDDYADGLSGPYGFTDVWDYPQFPAEKRHTSILATPDLGYPTATLWCGTDEEESSSDQLRRDLTHPRFDFIRDEIAEIL
ncbi:MAG: helix-turn-helix domain-containing protein [Clostridia bacterium]|nr:helix-turn-helix domain-containing protein [Clostridia bacterium]